MPLAVERDYRNSFEEKVANQLEKAGIKFGYENLKLAVNYPPRTARYTPDLIIDGSNIIIECKGYFFNSAADRQKLILVKEQHPDLDIRLVFQNSNTVIYKGSKTTYGQWASDHSFQWSDKGIIPAGWLAEIQEQQRDRLGKAGSSTRRKDTRAGKRRELRGRE